MTRKLLFAFDLSGKTLTEYGKIRKVLEDAYKKENVLEILNTTYIITHQSDTPEDLVNYMVRNGFIKSDDSCYCDIVTENARFHLNQQKTSFIQS